MKTFISAAINRFQGSVKCCIHYSVTLDLFNNMYFYVHLFSVMSLSKCIFFFFLIPTKRILVKASTVHTLKAQDWSGRATNDFVESVKMILKIV